MPEVDGIFQEFYLELRIFYIQNGGVKTAKVAAYEKLWGPMSTKDCRYYFLRVIGKEYFFDVGDCLGAFQERGLLLISEFDFNGGLLEGFAAQDQADGKPNQVGILHLDSAGHLPVIQKNFNPGLRQLFVESFCCLARGRFR